MSATSSICNFEWDGRLREYFHAYDSLVDDGSMVAALDAVVEQERATFRELFDDVATYRAHIHRTRDGATTTSTLPVSRPSNASPRRVDTGDGLSQYRNAW